MWGLEAEGELLLEGYTMNASRGLRLQCIDVYRGLAVILVVFGHIIDGVINAGLLVGHESFWLALYEWLYGLRMPAIALVLGAFIPYGVAKYGTWRYIARRTIMAAYLYAVWYVIQMGTELLTSRWKNTLVTVDDAMQFWLQPAHLWFIPYIAVSAIVVSLLRPWDRRPWLTLPLILLASTVLWGWSSDVIGLRGLPLIGFSAVGAVIGMKRFGRTLETHRGLILGLGLAAFGVSLFFFGTKIVSPSFAATPEQWVAGRLTWLPQSVTLAWLGQFILAGITVALASIPRIKDAFALIGRNTLQIYLAHILVTAGLRIILVKVGVTSPLVLIPLLLAAGVLLPLLAERMVRSTPLRYVFDVPASFMPRPAPEHLQRKERNTVSAA